MHDLPEGERYIRSGTKANFRLANPDDVKLTFSLTMSAPEWRHLAAQLPDDGSAAGQMHKMIRTMLTECLARVGAHLETTGWSGASPVNGAPDNGE